MNTTMNNVKQNWEPCSGERHARLHTIGNAPGRVLVAVTIAACLWTPMNSGARAQTYVTSMGSFAPEVDDVVRPFRLVEAAVVAERPDTLILVSSGIYKEAFIADKPCIIESSDGGVVTIGDLSAVATTTLKIATLNTHLFGDADWNPFVDSWQDDARAIDIGEICVDNDWDVVAFQEIWDENLFWGGDGQFGIWSESIVVYPYGDHGDETSGDPANSGLALMSRLPISDFVQGEFAECLDDSCDGLFDDCLANKGWIQARITKDGFPIHIFNTHTQAGTDPENEITRLHQLNCVVQSAGLLWEADPELTIVIVGDFNIDGESDEYMGLVEAMDGFNFLKDEARNAPGFDHDEHITSSEDNLLALCFDEDTKDARLDYVIVIPPLDESITVIPESVSVFPFLGDLLIEDCSEGPGDDFESDEKSDHWGVVAELKFFRN